MKFLEINKLVFIIILVLVYPYFHLNYFSSLNSSNIPQNVSLKKSHSSLIKQYVQIEELRVDSDEDFITHGFPGNGTAEDPYLIDSYVVHSTYGESTSFSIKNVTKHFIIQNCKTENTNGIILEGLNSGSAILRNNNIMRIFVIYPADIKTCISIVDCSNITVANNTCDSRINGIEISHSKNIIVSNNTLLNGIKKSSQDRRYCGLSLNDVSNCSVSNNYFEEGGIYLDTSEAAINSISIENNTILRWNEELHKHVKTNIMVLHNSNDVYVDASEYGQVLVINCSNIAITSLYFNNVFVGFSTLFSQNCFIYNGYSTKCQIGFLDYHSFNNEFKNLICYQNVLGFQLVSTENCKIKELVACESSFSEGIFIDEKSRNTILQESNCSYNSFSAGVIDLGSNSTFINTHFEYNYIGISLWSSTNSTLISNEIKYNRNYGVYISGSSNSLIYNNSISLNKNCGIYTSNSHTGIISTNLIFSSKSYGLYLSSTTENFLVYRNSFINNEPTTGTSQAFDSGKDNFWYHPEIKIGNYWSDKGSRKNYKIDGEAETYDLYPLKNPVYFPGEEYSWKASFPISSILVMLLILNKIVIKRNHKRK